MLLGFANNILLYNKAIDMRKQIDGLVVLVSSTLNKNPSDGSAYLFYNRIFDKIKLLYYSEGGFCLFYKSLEKGLFVIPNNRDLSYQISISELSYLLSGLDINLLPKQESNSYKIFY
jgi:transposase